MPSMPASSSTGTLRGPGPGPTPGAGCGNAVDRAGWNVMLPSTFCMIWWMWPFSTGEAPNGRGCSGARGPVVVDPAPLRVDGPERHVRVPYDGRAVREPGHVTLEPRELLGAEVAEPSRLEVQHIDEADEVTALIVEALPAVARPSGGEPAEVLGAAVGEDVVLPWDVERLVSAGALERLGHDVECARLLRVRDIAGVDDKGGLRVERLDAGDRRFEAAQGVLVGLALEADVSVADLDKVEAGRRGLGLGRASSERAGREDPALHWT